MMNRDTILDGNNEIAAAIILAGEDIAFQIKQLGNGNAATQMGAIEALGHHISESLDAMTLAIGALSINRD